MTDKYTPEQRELMEKIGSLCERYCKRKASMMASDVMIAMCGAMVVGIRANSVDKRAALNGLVAFMALELSGDADA
jgi:hypothetical protein